MQPHQFSPTSRFLLSMAAFVVVVAGMKAADTLLIPFLLSLFIAVISAPPLFFLKGKGVPGGLAMILVVGMIIVTGVLLAWLVGGSLDDFTNNLPKYQESLKLQSTNFVTWLSTLGVELNVQTITTYFNPAKAMAMAGKLMGGLGNVLTQAFLILITVIFMLLEANAFQAKLKNHAESPERSLARVKAITSSIKQYMVIKTSTSMLTGILIGVWLWILDIDYPVLWGVLAFLFNYVPNIGSIIAAVPAVLLALIQFGPQASLWTAVGYLVVNSLVGNVIEPRFMGKGLGLSPLIVFISLVFWGWILGPVGMFLSVPLTMTMKIVLDSNHDTRGLAAMLG
ncbi:MAG: AI-2E family transporter [Candidatus Thiodiazotropha endolucinida]|uniref:AI-2E family transporter n=1 Tax=Candidatus Thiodiazotropha taylori TaxID=2792791 RepID=A0A9E4TWS0_9GAMM|nr:AI-2E family transporter [Candidatus Thiodiazotropha taylori]MCG8095949.1 AI-2E family transporter [Candidatus Thiodiazotropha endolucinida]MCG8045959.1 AI-2E family transporter [Candidatus Thiodiazotropha taylori]MCG8060333.1 AI-2E family transporter [Candidatus Thiodiazotropha taylori]MCG8062674.1 AI-2E family transporter [Candidatus Thiodiazotropha taylori]